MRTTREARLRNGSLAVIALAAVALAWVPAAGQQINGGPTDESVEAVRLHEQAMALTDQPLEWKKAAGLLHEAAQARTPADARKVDDLYLAGSLYYAVGDKRHAQENFEQAAEAALEFGQVARAAMSYLNAAIVAKARDHAGAAADFGRKAERLAQSPHLTAAECDCIANRIVWIEPVTKYASR